MVNKFIDYSYIGRFSFIDKWSFIDDYKLFYRDIIN